MENKIAVKSGSSILFLVISDIVYIRANNIYCDIYLVSGEQIKVSSRFQDMHETLKEAGFFRVHRSSLINLNYLEKYDKSLSTVSLFGISEPVKISRVLKKTFEHSLSVQIH